MNANVITPILCTAVYIVSPMSLRVSCVNKVAVVIVELAHDIQQQSTSQMRQ